jgi:homoserine dehydrogenase
LARFNRVQMRYSGAVGAGTPVLSTARSLSRGDVITGVRAILNGTTNFILWKMLEQGAPYADVLREAQQLGYAETDPSTDVDGLDTATKVVILANSIFAGDGRSATVKDVVIEGIRGIASARVAEAAKRGKSIKLIGRIDLGMKGSASPTLSVRPEEVDRHGPMDVPRNLNAVQFTTRRAGDVTLVGAGAGGVQTATAIVRDIVDIWHSAEEERR